MLEKRRKKSKGKKERRGVSTRGSRGQGQGVERREEEWKEWKEGKELRRREGERDVAGKKGTVEDRKALGMKGTQGEGWGRGE